MSTGDTALELVALVRLGHGAKAASAPPGDVPVLAHLVKRGVLSVRAAQEVRAYVQKHSFSCKCGMRSLPAPDANATSCRGCGVQLVRGKEGGWHPVRVPGVGTRIGPLLLEGVLGQGAYGIVFLARHVELNRRSAVKILPGAALDDKRRARFDREVSALARLDHESIVKVHAAFVHENSLACEMELVPGETLEEKVDREGPLPWRDAATIVLKLARAIEHAHREDVLHRDLKPQNVLIRKSDGEPLLADFGLARFMDQSSSLTAANAIAGTPVYLAPEAFGGELSPQVDVYGLGAILYEALAGKPPFQEDNLQALIYKVTSGQCPPLSPEGAPRTLEQVRAKAMAVDPLDRYASAAALARDLEHVLHGEALEHSSLGALLARRVRKERKRGLLVVLLLAIAFGPAIVFNRLVRPKAMPDGMTVDGALALLSGTASTSSREALATLEGALRPGTSANLALVRGIDEAVARAPSSLELRRLRALVGKQRGTPLLADDLAAVGSLANAQDLEAVAAHAVTAGLVGAGALPAARGAWLANKDVRSAALLYALVASERGEVPLREEVVQAFKVARPSSEPGASLVRALVEVDKLAALVAREDPQARTAARRTNDVVRAALRDPRYERSLGLLLHPLAPVGRDLWRRSQFGNPGQVEVRRAVVDLLDGFLDKLPPFLLGIAEALRTADPESKEEMKSTEAALAAASEQLEEEPLVAAHLLDVAAQRADQRGDEEVALRRYARQVALVESWLVRSTAPADSVEDYWAHVILRRGVNEQGAIHEHRAERSQDPEIRRREREVALPLRRRAFDIACSSTWGTNVRGKDARYVVKLLFELGRPGEIEPLTEWLGRERESVRAEVLRRQDQPDKALALLEKETGVDAESVRALALIDLGRKDEARAALEKIVAFEKRGEFPCIDELQSARWKARLEK